MEVATLVGSPDSRGHSVIGCPYCVEKYPDGLEGNHAHLLSVEMSDTPLKSVVIHFAGEGGQDPTNLKKSDFSINLYTHKGQTYINMSGTKPLE